MSSDAPVDWEAFCTDLMHALRGEFLARSAEVAHVKMLLTAPGGQIAANLTGINNDVALRGSVSSALRETKLTINARVQMPPEDLRAITLKSLESGGERIHCEIV